jgi:hypothetical protein
MSLQVMHSGSKKKHVMESFNLRFEPEIKAKLSALADRNGMSLANVVRSIVAEWLAARGTSPSVPLTTNSEGEKLAASVETY